MFDGLVDERISSITQYAARFIQCLRSNYVFPLWSKSPFSIRATILAVHLWDGSHRFKRNILYRLSINRATTSLAYVLRFARAGMPPRIEPRQFYIKHVIERDISRAKYILIKRNDTQSASNWKIGM